MATVDLGFPEEREKAELWLSNRYFPSKVGGRPAWLELESLPTKEQLQCGICKEPMSFLCQIYAPGEDEHNFHRTLYVFVCREAKCQKPNDASNLTVLRCQLPLKNDFFSTEPPAETGDPLPEIPTQKKLCLACGCPGPFACGSCRNVNFCSQKHQKAMWPMHKKTCSLENNTTAQPAKKVKAPAGVVFPEYEIVIETESDYKDPNEKSKDDAKEEKRRLREFEKLAAQGKTGTFKDIPDEELDKYTEGAEAVEDKHFSRFKKATSNEPEQILRYKRNGDALWIADVEKTVKAQLKNVPPCELCGRKREFEFQIMPQMLLLLKDVNVDWGVLAVYTCPKNCQIPKNVGYAKEYIIKQDIVAEEAPRAAKIPKK